MIQKAFRCILFSCYVVIQLVKVEAATLSTSNLTVVSNFSMCDLANAKVVSTKIDCESLVANDYINKSPESYYILHQRAHPIEGMLVFCEVSFMFYAHLLYVVISIDLKRFEQKGLRRHGYMDRSFFFKTRCRAICVFYKNQRRPMH